MRFLAWEFDASAGEVIEVELSSQANVRLLDGHSFRLYESGREHRYRGGLAKTSPFRLVVPARGHWHVVVELGGYAGSVNASARLLQRAR